MIDAQQIVGSRSPLLFGGEEHASYFTGALCATADMIAASDYTV
jgi:hypothetical protein